MQVADFLGVSVSTVRSWIWQKKIPYVKLGRAVRIRAEGALITQAVEARESEAEEVGLGVLPELLSHWMC